MFAQLHHFAEASEDTYGSISYLLLSDIKSVFWIDKKLRMVVLTYLENETTCFQKFVANIVSAILRGSGVEQ